MEKKSKFNLKKKTTQTPNKPQTGNKPFNINILKKIKFTWGW